MPCTGQDVSVGQDADVYLQTDNKYGSSASRTVDLTGRPVLGFELDGSEAISICELPWSMSSPI